MKEFILERLFNGEQEGVLTEVVYRFIKLPVLDVRCGRFVCVCVCSCVVSSGSGPQQHLTRLVTFTIY